MRCDDNMIFVVSYYLSGRYGKGWTSSWVSGIYDGQAEPWLTTKINHHYKYKDYIYHRVRTEIEEQNTNVTIRNGQIIINLNV